MSGIAGIIRFDGAPVEPGLVEKMTSAIAHRGPDGINHWVKGSVALGQCMLRTTPESLEEKQPLSNEDESLVLVMDGRVDNWEELRRELLGRGAVLRDRSDAELVLKAYEIWGRECLPHIDGDFALVIWDARKRTAFCARDRMGNKPFHYHWNGSSLVFASELHLILALPWVAQVPNEGMLVEFLAAEWYSRDETLWHGIMRLVAAHCMEVGSRGPQPKQYWVPDLWTALPYTKDEEYIEHYRKLLADTIRRLSRSHRPAAIQVSGGLDSSAVFCMAERLRRVNRLLAPSIEGYTFAFTDNSQANEVAYARAVGEYLGIPIHEIPPSIMPFSWYEERARAYRDFPGYPNGVMCVDLMRQASLQGSRVVLTGQGGDQWLQGSQAYYAEELAQRHWSTLYDCFCRDAKVFGKRQALKWLLRHGLFPLLPMAIQESLRRLVRSMRGSANRETYWLSPEMQETIQFRRAQYCSQHPQRVRSYFQEELLRNLHDPFMVQVIERFEREGALSGIEIRHPFWDHRIAQFAFSTPERLRLHGSRTKYIHVQALQGILPPIILERTSKAEFSSVFQAHLDAMQQSFSMTLPHEHAKWLAPDGMKRLYKAYQDTPQSGRSQWALWGIYGCDKVFF